VSRVAGATVRRYRCEPVRVCTRKPRVAVFQAVCRVSSQRFTCEPRVLADALAELQRYGSTAALVYAGEQ